jgi:hypothetical protein
MSKRTDARAQARQARLMRLPPMIQHLIADKVRGLHLLAATSAMRTMIAAGHEPTPGLGLTELEAMVAIVSDALGVKRLSDEE